MTFKERIAIATDPQRLAEYTQAYQLPTPEAAIGFIENWVFTYDPRRTDAKTIPFELYERQRELVRWLWKHYSGQTEGAVDKARGVGFSWTVIAFAVWLVIFHRDVSVGIYSYKETEVHRLGDISTLMEKAIFIIRKLPPSWQQGIKCTHMHIQNTISGSDIVGSSGDNPGRGGRRSLFIADEAAFYPRPESIEAALSETARCKIWGSTHSGTNTLFFRKVTSGATDVFVMNWWDNPQHDRQWYESKREKYEAEGMLHVFKREIERNAAASVEAVLIPSEWVAAAEHIDPAGGVRIAALDVADEGGDTNALVIREGNCVIYAEERSEGDTSETTDWAFWKAVEFACDEFRYDAVGIGGGIKARTREIQESTDSDIARTIKVRPYYASGEVVRPNDRDYNDRKNKDFFENKKAQDYFSIRQMVLGSYRAQQGKDYDETALMSLATPEGSVYAKMKRELSQPQQGLSKNGRMMIRKAPGGAKSPNLADALVMSFAEVESAWLPWFSV